MNSIEENLKRELRQWKETAEILGNKETMKSINISLKQFSEGKGIPLSEL